MKLLLVAVLACLGCEKKAPATNTPEKAPEEKPKPAPRPQTKLTVTLAGKPVAMATALAWKSWDGLLRVTASSVPLSCADVTGDGRAIADGEVSFELSAGHSLQPDGTLKGEVRSTYFSGMNKQESLPTTLVGDGTPGAATTVDVDFTTTAVDDAKALVVKGTIDALGCAAPAKATKPLPPPMGATIDVAGKKLPVRFARWSTQGDMRTLELFTGAESCKPAAFETPSELRVGFVWMKAGEPKVSQIDLNGTLVSPKADQTFDKKNVTFTPMPAGAGDVDVKADVKVMGYPLKIDGKITVTECPK